jgi:hypothetical protein
MNIINKVRVGMIMLSKAVGIVLCLYYIINYNDYGIVWNFSIWLMSSWMSQLNSILATMGTFILVLPLSIIATSILIENKYLNIMSIIFSISGGIVSMMIAAHNGTLEEYSNFKLFIIYHAVTLEEKRVIFIREYKVAMVTLAEESAKKLDYLRDRLTDTYMAVYENAIIKMPAKDVKNYAVNTVNDLLLNYDKKQPGILKRMTSGIGDFIYNHPKEIVYSVAVIVILIGGYKLVRMFFQENEPIVEGAKIALASAIVSKEGSSILIENAKVDEGMIKIVKGVVEDILKPMQVVQERLVNDIVMIGEVLAKYRLDINNLNSNANKVNKMITKLVESASVIHV